MPEPLTIAAIGGAVLNALNSSRQSGQADQLQQEALDLARRDFDSRGPAREAFLNGVLAPMPEAPDLSAVFADPSNPFSTGGIAPQQVPSGLDFSSLGPRSSPGNGGMVERRDPTVFQPGNPGTSGDGGAPITDPLPGGDPLGFGKPTTGDGDLPPMRTTPPVSGLPPIRPAQGFGGPSIQPPAPQLPPTRFPGVQPVAPTRLDPKNSRGAF